jgi:hypothetical protein
MRACKPGANPRPTALDVSMLTWLEPTAYRTRCEHANHYTTDVVTQYMSLLTANEKQNLYNDRNKIVGCTLP